MSLLTTFLKKKDNCDCKYLKESISRGIVEPGIVGRAAVAGVQPECLSGQLLGGKSARVGHPASRSTDGVAFLLPGVEALDFAARLGVLDPLDDLSHGDKVDVVVLGDDFVNPEKEGVHKLGIVLEPSGVEEETERSAVLGVVAVKVVVEEGVELFTGQNVGARVNHGAAWQVFVEFGIFTTIQFVHD